MHNLSVDYALNGDYAEAVKAAGEAYGHCRAFYGYPDHPSVLYQQNSFARCKRLAGNYDEALEMMYEINSHYRSMLKKGVFRGDHPWFLLHKIDLAASRRDMGLSNTGLEDLAEEIEYVHSRCWGVLDNKHPLTLAAAMMHVSLLRRMHGRLGRAAEVVLDARRRYVAALGRSHPYTYSCGMLLESIRRQLSTAKDQQVQMEHGFDFTPLPL
jgi:hypothetical protein